LKGPLRSLLERAKAMSEAKDDLALIINKWLEALKTKELVEKMFTERLEQELLVYQI
jgi:hypothetical protein